jgi:hypothetical protein
MQRSIIATVAVLVAAGLTVSCSGTLAPESPTQPTELSAGASASFSTTAQTVVAQSIGHVGGCPAIAPFSVPIHLVVRVNGGVNIFITQIRMRFTDPFRIEMPQVTLPAPMLTRQFGTNLVEARSTRTFPLTLAVGCGTDRKGTAVILVDTRDERGRTGFGQVSVAVR